jgi:hypothetical protein
MPVNISYLLFVRIVKLHVLNFKKITSMGLKIAGVKIVVKISLLEMLEKVRRYAESSLRPELIFVLNEF